MGYAISYVFKVWKPVWTLGSLKTPNTVNVSILGNGSKVKEGHHNISRSPLYPKRINYHHVLANILASLPRPRQMFQVLKISLRIPDIHGAKFK